MCHYGIFETRSVLCEADARYEVHTKAVSDACLHAEALLSCVSSGAHLFVHLMSPVSRAYKDSCAWHVPPFDMCHPNVTMLPLD